MHCRVLEQLGATAREVRHPRDLEGADAIILPGGESSTMSMLIDRGDLREPLTEFFGASRPVLGTCAGAILLGREILDGRADQRSFGVIDATVRRNAYGRQVDSFEEPLEVSGLDGSFPGVFIRAPVIEAVGPDVEVLASLEDRPVMCRSRSVTICTFHPELSGDSRVHQAFLDAI